VADELYEQVEPLAYHDERHGYALHGYVCGLAKPLEEIDALVRDTDAGPGWSAFLDPVRCPAWALGWLAQFPGVRPLRRLATETEEQWAAAMRERIVAADGRWRGGVEALRAAAQRRLTGNRYVIFNERVGGDPYVLGIRTLDAETPDPAATLRDILEQKPAGVVLDYGTVPGQTWDALVTAYDDWAAVQVAYDTWDETRQNLP
jgi:hypothetical protein